MIRIPVRFAVFWQPYLAPTWSSQVPLRLEHAYIDEAAQATNIQAEAYAHLAQSHLVKESGRVPFIAAAGKECETVGYSSFRRYHE